MPEATAQSKFLRTFLFIGFGWLACSSMYMERYAHRIAPFLLIIGLIGIAVALLAPAFLQKLRFEPSQYWFIGLWILMASLFSVIHPLSQQHTVTQGNDSEDALFRGGVNLLHLHFPYIAKTYLGNPITPMPGALFLSLPFTAMGKTGAQNLLWLGVLMFFALKYFRLPSTAFVFIFTVLANAHVFMNFATGADYPINCFYVSAAMFWFLSSSEGSSSFNYWASAIFLGFALSSRPTYLLLMPPLVIAYLVQHIGLSRAIRRAIPTFLVFLAVTVPIYLVDPAHFSPLHVKGFLTFLPPLYEHILFATLVTIALAFSCTGFFIRLNFERLYLLAALATGTILFPPSIIAAIREHFTVSGLLMLGYTDTAFIFACLWGFHYLERSSRREPALAPSV